MAYQSKHTGNTIDNAIDQVAQLLNIFYPIGSIYTSTKSTSPATLFGGTWVQIKDTFLLTAGDTYSAGATGGAATHTHTSAAHTHTTAGHTLTINEIPSHNHATYGQVPRINDSSVSGDTYGHTTQQSWWFKSCASSVNYTGGGASHSHGNTGSTTPGSTGSSSNLPPYRVVYAWERTA